MSFARRLAAILARIGLGLLLVEGLARAAVALGIVELPHSPAAGFELSVRGVDIPAERLFVFDGDLIQRMRGGFRLRYNRRIRFPGKPEQYEVRTNEHGFRTPPFTREKPAHTLRIVCLGDSSTFGLNVEEDAAYPRVLGRLLEERFPGRFEVLNLGIPGHTTRQGLELLRREVLDLDPDLVFFAFGTNDRFYRVALSDDEIIRFSQSAAGRVVRTMSAVLGPSCAYGVLRQTVSRFVERPTERPVESPDKRRVSLEEMRDSLAAAADLLARRQVNLVIVNNDFSNTDARLALATGAERTGAVLVDAERLLTEARRARSRKIEEERGLPPAAPRKDAILVRVAAPGSERVEIRLQRIGKTPLVVPLGDDGRDGDQVAGDEIWSGYVPGQPGRVLRYVYFGGRGAEIEKEFADNPILPPTRVQTSPPSGIGDIDTFGEMFLFSDGSHPDEEGHRLIAERLLDVVLTNRRVRQAVGESPRS